MRKIKLSKIKTVHFIGIGGVSMSGLALICKSWGMQVTGSDKQNNQITQNLENNNIKVYNTHKQSNIPQNADMVVYTSAIDKNNCELVQATKQCQYVLERAQFLQLVSKQFKNIIAVSGTHGKTTTCGMLASIFSCANLSPTVHIGGIINGFNTNCIIGKKDIFITEACEYKKHLLQLKPTVSAVLNIEPDHMECYKNISHLKRCFIKFLKKAKVGVSNLNLKSKKHINYCNTYTPINLILHADGCYQFTILDKNQPLIIKLGICGKHNIQNALCAITISKLFCIPNQHIQQGLLQYKGIQRRFEVLGKKLNATFITDYAHHPTEIQTTINTLKEQQKPYIIIFQPHTYSRTEKLLSEFKTVLSSIPNLYIYKTYPARETKDKGMCAKQLADNLKNSQYVGNKQKLKRIINKFIDKDINIVFIGAGDIADIAKQILP